MMLMLLALAVAAPVLDDAKLTSYVQRFNAGDEELYHQDFPNAAALEFLRANAPRFECPDADLERTYYFRWWTYRKHLQQSPDGWVVTEFLPKVGWAGKHNTISCAASHHLYEGRWLRDPRYLDNLAPYWLTKAPHVHAYSNWLADAVVARAAVTGDVAGAKALLPDLAKDFRRWEREKRDATGLFWQVDGADGMEVALGGTGYRATINSYMFGNALALATLCDLSGQPDAGQAWRVEAARLKQVTIDKLWDADAQFFKVRRRAKNPATDPLPPPVDVREQLSFTPWLFGLAEPAQDVAWKQLMDPQGFYAPFGPTTAERRHPGFKLAYSGHECQWNGPSWPYSTCSTLTALANLLNTRQPESISRRDYFETLRIYARSHLLRPGVAPAPSLEPRGSGDNSVPRHTWWSPESLGTTQWVQYEFAQPVTADATEVYWFEDNAGCRVPAAWKLQTQDAAGAWSDLVAPAWPTAKDKYNRVEFAPVAARAFRLSATAQAGKSAGILRWRLLNGKTDLSPTAKPSASYTDKYSGRLDALNAGGRTPEPPADPAAEPRPWIDENLNPLTGDWIARTLLLQRRQQPRERGKDYNHSTFCDLVISGLVGLRPRLDQTVEVNPLLPVDTWDWFCLDGVRYHGHDLTICWDRTGERYHRGAGLRVLCDGREVAAADRLTRVTAALP